MPPDFDIVYRGLVHLAGLACLFPMVSAALDREWPRATFWLVMVCHTQLLRILSLIKVVG